MNERTKLIAKTGYLSKGIVYALTGFLAFLSAVGTGGSTEGKTGVLDFLEKQAFGNILLLILGLGLLAYAFWRFVQSLSDPENIGNDLSGLGKRFGFFLSGTFYMSLAGLSFYKVLLSDGGSSGNSPGSLIPDSMSEIVFYIIGFGLVIKAIFQFVKVYKGDFLEKFQLDTNSKINNPKTIKYLGYAGLIARGIVVAIIAYFFLKAAQSYTQSTEMKGTSEAFSFIKNNSEGPLLMGLVAVGLICYGIYMIIMAKYRVFKD